VFFANYLLPGVEVTDQTKIPHFGGDLPFAAGLGLLNAIVYPIFKRALSRLAMATIILNFVAYGVIKFLPLGIDMVNFLGYLTACVVVSAGCFIIHFFASRNEVPFNHMHEGM
jgi:hypothetical protein